MKQEEKYGIWTKVKNSRKNRSKHQHFSSKAFEEEVVNIKPFTRKEETEKNENKR